jgi:hypothetical protein
VAQEGKTGNAIDSKEKNAWFVSSPYDVMEGGIPMSGRMTDEQFDRLYELLRLCKEKMIATNVRHRIAIEIAHAGDIEYCLRKYRELIETGHIPATDGIPRKITLISNSVGFGPCPEEKAEVEQRLTINDRGQIFVTYYNYAGTILRKERFHISVEKAIKFLQDINTAFCIRTDSNFVTDVGTWELVITNTEGRAFTFNGSLNCNADPTLGNLSANLRKMLDHPMLLCFDGEAKKLLRFVSVCFEYGEKEYCYLADDSNLAVGDTVVVPVGEQGRTTEANIVAIDLCTEEDAPYPVHGIKRIIGRKEPVMPESPDRTLFDAVKAVIDALDPEGLLAMDAPPDEYDGESKSITRALKADMTARQIAEIMADIFSSSFSDPFDTNYFMVAATWIKEHGNFR